MKQWGDIFTGVGTLVLSLLSCAICPLCLPMYAGLLSFVGIELGGLHAFFFPIMIIFSFVTLGFMAYQIYTREGKWAPFKLALGAAFGMGVFSFYDYEYALYACLALFMGSILWNKKSLIHADRSCC